MAQREAMVGLGDLAAGRCPSWPEQTDFPLLSMSRAFPACLMEIDVLARRLPKVGISPLAAVAAKRARFAAKGSIFVVPWVWLRRS
jgi:hypothetical protein